MRPVYEDFTDQAQEVAQQAYDIAKRYHHWFITTEHVLLALLESPNERLQEIYSRLGVRVADARYAVSGILQTPQGASRDAMSINQVHVTRGVKVVIEEAQLESRRLSSKVVNIEHILLGLVRVYQRADINCDPVAVSLVNAMALTPDPIRRALRDMELGLDHPARDK